jgi:hypothetical protein
MPHELETPHQPQTISNAEQRDEEDALRPVRDLLCYLKDYASRKPEVAALTCLAVGFVLGWKLKPW